MEYIYIKNLKMKPGGKLKITTHSQSPYSPPPKKNTDGVDPKILKRIKRTVNIDDLDNLPPYVFNILKKEAEAAQKADDNDGADLDNWMENGYTCDQAMYLLHLKHIKEDGFDNLDPLEKIFYGKMKGKALMNSGWGDWDDDSYIDPPENEDWHKDNNGRWVDANGRTSDDVAVDYYA